MTTKGERALMFRGALLVINTLTPEKSRSVLRLLLQQAAQGVLIDGNPNAWTNVVDAFRLRIDSARKSGRPRREDLAEILRASQGKHGAKRVARERSLSPSTVKTYRSRAKKLTKVV